MEEIITSSEQDRAKKTLEAWMKERGVEISDLARTLSYTYQHTYQLVRGDRPLTAEFIGRFLAAYGAETAQMISDALNGGNNG